MVDQSDLTLVSSEISGITNTSFQSTTVAQFSNVISVPSATFKMKNVKISWGEGAGTMAELVHSNTLPVKGDEDLTMKAKAKVVNADNLAAFNQYLMHHESGTWSLDGEAEVNCYISATIRIKKKLTLSGFNDFPIPPEVYETNITAGTATALYTSARVGMTSLSNVKMALNQPLYFHFEYNGELIGNGYIPDYVMTPGFTSLVSFMAFSYNTKAQQQALMQLLSNYANGKSAMVTMKNFYIDPPITWMTPALKSMEMTAPLPSIVEPMIKLCTVYYSINLLKLPFTMTLYNPQTIPITVTAIKGNVTVDGMLVSDMDIPNLSPPIVVPARSTITTPKLTASHSYVNQASTKLIAQGGGVGSTHTRMGGLFGSFPIDIFYNQAEVPIVVKK